MTDAADSLRFVAPYRVRFDEAGPNGTLRTSGLLRYAQDVAWQHSEARGLTRAWYAERGLAWVVRAAELELLRPIPIGADLAVETRVVGYQRIWAQRRAECRLPDGELAAAIRTDWVMIDARGRLARVPAEIAERFPAPVLAESVLRVDPGPVPDEAVRDRIRVRPHELDPMNHPNNAVYVDWLEEAFAATPGAAATPTTSGPLRHLALEYVAAAAPGEVLERVVWRLPSGSGWGARLTGEGGREVFRAVARG